MKTQKQKMGISPDGLKLISEFEGVKLERYQDVAGLWTIGVGHLITGNENPPIGKTISMEEAMELLRQDVQLVVDEFNDEDGFCDLPEGTSQEEFDACVSLAFNIGLKAMNGSTALRMMHDHETEMAGNAFLLWRKAGGKVVQGLINRRERERKLFLTGRYE